MAAVAAATAAAAPPAPGSRSALIVGVSVYASSEVPTLEGVPMDMISARTMAHAMGIPDARIVELRDAKATKAAILAALEQMADSVTEGGRAFLYFSGHGTRWYDPQLKGCKEGLLAHDSQTLTNEEIARSTRRMSERADKVMVLFDACHSDGVGPSSQARTRSLQTATLTPKFFLKGGQDANSCARASNLRTRSLVAEATRLGALQENYVQITSARADEVSFDDARSGGLATQGVRQCLLSKATDRDGSGANSIAEIERCAQAFVDERLKPFPDLAPHRITVTGNRNLVPVAVPRPPPAGAPAAVGAAVPGVATAAAVAGGPAAAAVGSGAAGAAAGATAAAAATAAVATDAAATAQAAARPPEPGASPGLPVAAAPTGAAGASVSGSGGAGPTSALPSATAATAATVATSATSAASATSSPAAVPPALASLATLQDIEQQRNPRRQLDVALTRQTLRIGKDPLELTLTSSHAGHVYLVMLGSDRKSFYLLFPNGLDADNRIEARKPLRLPRPDWQLVAAGPEGQDHLLVMVTDTARDLRALTASPPSSAAPFTFTLNDLGGRTALLDFLIGSGTGGGSESFGARVLTIQEVR